MGAFFQDREIDVLHITKANSGGAALAAKRISDAMCMSNGVRSTIQYLDGPESKTVWCRACESIDRRVNELGNEEFQISLIKSYRSNVILRNQKADILNIHWLPGVLSHSLINQMKNYPKVFWTLHDMNPFTGVCHQSGDCLKFEKNCKSCPAMVSSLKPLSQKVWQYRRNLYSSFDSLNFIAPSRWMAEVAGKSPLMAGKKIYQVYNPQKFEDTPNKKFTEDFLNIAILGSNYHSSKGSPESVIILNRLIREFHNEVAVTVIGDLPPELVKPARIYQLPEKLLVENHEGNLWQHPQTIPNLKKLNLPLEEVKLPGQMGRVHALFYDASLGKWHAAADPDWSGTALGLKPDIKQ